MKKNYRFKKEERKESITLVLALCCAYCHILSRLFSPKWVELTFLGLCVLFFCLTFMYSRRLHKMTSQLKRQKKSALKFKQAMNELETNQEKKGA